MKNLLVLAAHEPSIDPRVDWVVNTAADAGYKVEVYGINLGRRRPDYENAGLRRFDLGKPGPLTFFRMLQTWFGAKRVAVLFWLSIPLFILFLPFAVIYDAAIVLKNLLRGTWLLRVTRFVVFKGIKKATGTVWPELYLLLYLLFKHFLGTAVSFYNHYSNNIQPVDAIHANDLDTLLPGVLIKKISGARLVYDAHEFYPYQFVNSSYWFIVVLKWYENILLKHVDEIVTVTPQLADVMQREYGLSKKIHSVPNCSPLHPSVSEKQVLSENKTFLFQGNFSDGRGIKTLLQFWSQLNLPNSTLVMRGPHNSYRQECIDLATSLEILNRNVIFADPVDENQLIEAAREAVVGVIPYEPVSINNRFCCPNKLSQYMQAGMIILSNDLPFVSQTLSEYQCGLTYNNESFSSFKESVQKILSDHEFTKKCRANSIKYSMKEFNWENKGAIFLKLYSNPMEMPT